MPVAISSSRPLSVTTESLPVSLVAAPAVENNTTKEIELRIAHENFTPDPFTVSITTTNGQPTITGTNLSGLRLGDAIAHANITGTITALNTSVSPNTATVSANATGSGTVTANVTPPTFDLAVLDISVLVTAIGSDRDPSKLLLTVRTKTFDGTDAKDSNDDDRDDAANGRIRDTLKYELSMDAIFAAARLSRT